MFLFHAFKDILCVKCNLRRKCEHVENYIRYSLETRLVRKTKRAVVRE